MAENILKKYKFEVEPFLVGSIGRDSGVPNEDWYGLDFKYLSNNSESIFFKSFIHIHDVPDYLDYFPKGAFEKQTKYTNNYYFNEKTDINREFKYLTEEEMDKYIINTTKTIEKI